MVSDVTVPYGRPMSDMATPTQEQPATPPSDDLPPADGTPRIFGGVAAAVADGLGFDALWVRIGFVLLALAGGIGLVVYGALWLVIVAAPEWGYRGLALAGGAILVAGLPIILGGFSLDSPLVLFIVLGGLALALWQPRPATPPEVAVSKRSATVPTMFSPRRRPPAPRREPSPLGSITLGCAMVVAAGGALIDLANGGRLHPEQWLGAAAIVCGVGLLVGTVRGHARWLIVPAIALVGLGGLSGEMAKLDIGAGDMTGERWIWVDSTTTGPITARTGLGTVQITISEAPTAQLRVDARVAIGTITISTNDDVAVDVFRRGMPVTRIGRADGTADVTVDARVGIGRIDLDEWSQVDEAFDDGFVEPLPGRPDGLGELTLVADGVSMTGDGWFVLAEGEVVLDDQNRVVIGDPFDGGDGTDHLVTSYGEFTVLPRGLLITPYEQVLDLEAIRADLVTPDVDTTELTTPLDGDQP